MYQLIHAAALLSVANSQYRGPTSGISWKFMFLGTTLFSGSIYLLTLDIGPKRLLGPSTPVGGLMMIGGWAMVGMGRP